MFGDVVNPSIRLGAKKWWYMPMSIIVHTVLLGAIVIIPLMAVGAVPTPSGMAAFWGAAPPPAPAAPAARASAAAAGAAADGRSEYECGPGRSPGGNQTRSYRH